MADIAADVHAEVTSDSAGGGIAWLGGTKELSALSGGVGALPNHGKDGRGLHELDQTTEERLILKVSVMRLEVSLRGSDELHSDKLETFLLEARDDGTAQVALNTVRLNHDESLLLGHIESIELGNI